MKITRRNLLKSAGAWALVAPVLLSQRRLMADGVADMPKRVVVVFSPNGPIIRQGPAEGEENSFKIHEWWGPLERHKQDGVFFHNVYQAGVPFGEHNQFGHQSAGTGALTATTTMGTNKATGPSIDQFIGQELQKMGVVTPRRSVLWGMHDKTGHWGPWYAGSKGVITPVSPVNDPYKALAELAPSLGSPQELAARREKVLRRHFLLDQAYQDCKPLRGELGAEGRRLLDQHCSEIEGLEQRVLASLGGGQCELPAGPGTTLPQGTNFGSPETRDGSMDAFIEMMSLAFKCDLTRVMGLSFGGASARFRIPESYKIPGSDKVDSGDSGPAHHPWTHVNPGAYSTSRWENEVYPNKLKALGGFTTWYAEQVASIIDRLKQTPDGEPGKSLFDTTLVLWTSELGFSGSGISGSKNPHPNQRIPVMLFGNSMGKFKTGRLYLANSDKKGKDNARELAMPLHKMFVSMCRHAGLSSVDTFGNAGAGPLDWLEG